MTYHGPGQFIAYPILDLLHNRQSLQWYAETLATVMSDAVKTTFKLDAFFKSCPSLVGLWLSKNGKILSKRIGDSAFYLEKVGFIGLQGQRWVVSHGCSVNLKESACLGFKDINACGLGKDVKIVSCEERSGLSVTRADFEDAFIEAFKNRFNYSAN